LPDWVLEGRFYADLPGFDGLGVIWQALKRLQGKDFKILRIKVLPKGVFSYFCSPF
jgi:hypothetical protein